ncbi:unnamed protein product, partial [Mesorhabditis belari]|uniref:CUB domain-containing protein n=1 Tax=Mesorhabditis belari TaxID=2138241 RepID=A0AAF3FE43_9BILA
MLKICPAEQKLVEFSVQTGPNRCICSMEEIILSHDTNISLAGFPYGVCGRTTCESEVSIAATEENSTHYERILLERRHWMLPTSFNISYHRNALENIRLMYVSRACQCGQIEYTLDDSPIWVSSPYYPANYCNNMDCSYLITAADGAKIRIVVIALSVSYNDQVTYEEHGITNKYSGRVVAIFTSQCTRLTNL